MAEILRAPTLDRSPVRLPGPDDIAPETVAVMNEAWQQGYDAGWQQGRLAGRAELGDFVVDLNAAVDRAIAGYAATCTATRNELSTHLLDLAQALVEGVLGHLPDTATQGVLGRLEAALELIEDGPLTVLVHPSTMDMLDPVLELRAGGQPLQRRADDRLAPGELVIEGPWAFAELTWPRLLDAARTALTELQDASNDTVFDDIDASEPGTTP